MRQGVRKVFTGDLECLFTGLPVLLINIPVLTPQARLKKINFLFPVLCSHLNALLNQQVVVGGGHGRDGGGSF